MRDSESASAQEAWRALPAATRRYACQLAVIRAEPHPDPAVAATASAFATARLASMRRIPAVAPLLAAAAALAGIVTLMILLRPGPPATWLSLYVVLSLLAGTVAATGIFWGCAMQMKVVPRRLRMLAAAGPAEPGQVIFRYRRHWPYVPAVAQLAASAACFALMSLSTVLRSLIPMAIMLAGHGWRSARRSRRSLPEPAACRIGRAGVAFLSRYDRPDQRRNVAGCSQQELSWSDLTSVLVFEAGPGAQTRHRSPVIAFLGREGKWRESLAGPARWGVSPAQWVRASISPLVLDTGELDHSAGEIIAALTAWTSVPVEHCPLPEPQTAAGPPRARLEPDPSSPHTWQAR